MVLRAKTAREVLKSLSSLVLFLMLLANNGTGTFLRLSIMVRSSLFVLLLVECVGVAELEVRQIVSEISGAENERQPPLCLASVQNEHPHCDIRVRFSPLYSPRHSLQVNFAVGLSGALPTVGVVAGTITTCFPLTTVGLGGASMTDREVTDTRLLAEGDDEDVPELELVDAVGDDEEARGDDVDDEDDDSEKVLVSRSKLLTLLSLSVIAGFTSTPLELVPLTATKPPLEMLSEYRDPAAASDKRLEQREHVATETQCRKRFFGFIGSIV